MARHFRYSPLTGRKVICLSSAEPCVAGTPIVPPPDPLVTPAARSSKAREETCTSAGRLQQDGCLPRQRLPREHTRSLPVRHAGRLEVGSVSGRGIGPAEDEPRKSGLQLFSDPSLNETALLKHPVLRGLEASGARVISRVLSCAPLSASRSLADYRSSGLRPKPLARGLTLLPTAEQMLSRPLSEPCRRSRSRSVTWSVRI